MKVDKPSQKSYYLILMIFFVLFIFGGLLAFNFLKTTNKIEFSTYELAEQAGLIGRGGVLPEFLPQSASKIKAIINIDSNERWIGFVYQDKNINFMDRFCSTIEPEEVDFPDTKIHRKVDWWPMSLDLHTDVGKKDSSRYKFFTCSKKISKMENHLAVIKNDEENLAFFWTLSDEFREAGEPQ